MSKATLVVNIISIKLCLQVFGHSLKDELDSTDLHIHFPAGAVGKDGPSAGVTVITVLVSLLSDVCVRSDTAMTGEITLRGLVLPVSIHDCRLRFKIEKKKYNHNDENGQKNIENSCLYCIHDYED